MNCNVIRDLIPLYVDGCCCEESSLMVKEHLDNCEECKKIYESMKEPESEITVVEAPSKLKRVNGWYASILQSFLFLLSFAIITVGVYFEVRPIFFNGIFAFNLVIPVTGFMVSLTNWYFVNQYKSQKSFSNVSMLITLLFTLGAFIWGCWHYEYNWLGLIFSIFTECGILEFFEILPGLLLLGGGGLVLGVILAFVSRIFSKEYADLLGKE